MSLHSNLAFRNLQCIFFIKNCQKIAWQLQDCLMSVRDVFLIDKQFYINLYRFNQCPSRVFIIVSNPRSPFLRTESTLIKVISLSIQSGLKNPPISKAQYIYQDSKTLALTLLFQNILTTPPIKAIHNTSLGNAQ